MSLSINDEILIQDMIYNLDMTIYDKLSKEGKKYIDYSLGITIQSRDFITLLHNYKNRDSIKYPSTIIGPKTLLCLESKIFNKKIYLFGELHIPYKDKECEEKSVRPFDFFNYLFNTTYTPIDFYIETYPLTTIKPTEEYDLYHIRYMFRNCFGYKKNKCEYPGNRFHFVDIRDIHKFPHIGRLNPKDNIPILVDYLLRETFPKFESDYLKLLEKQKNKTNNEYIRTYIDKTISDLRKNIKSFRYDAFQDMYFRLTGEKKNLLSTVEFIKQSYIYYLSNENKSDEMNKIIKEIIHRAYLFCTAIYTPIVDAYTLARMFRKFRKVDNIISIEPRNIIFYGGLSHVENMCSVLLDMGFELKTYESKLVRDYIESHKAKYPYCTDISSIKTFFDY